MNVPGETSTANYQQVLTYQGENVYLNVVVSIGLLSLISLWGVVANILNLIVFLRQTSQDTVSTSLIGLSVADLCMTMTTFLGCVFKAWELIDPNSPLSPRVLFSVVTRFPIVMFYDISATLMIFVSMERCLCVIIPFKVRNIFTRRRAVIIVVLIYIFSLAIFSPLIFGFYQLTWISLDGQSRLIMIRNPQYFFYNQVIGLSKGLCFFTVAQILVFCFSAAMIYSLKISHRFRQDSSGNASPMLKKERILMRTVLFVAILFFISNSGSVMVTFTRMLVPGFNRIGEYAHIYLNVAPLINVLFTTSSSFNSVIYYTTSSRYRAGIQRIFGKQVRQTTSTHQRPVRK